MYPKFILNTIAFLIAHFDTRYIEQLREKA